MGEQRSDINKVLKFGKIGDVLSSETSLRLLAILSKGPQSVKNLANLLGKHESHISEKISALRKLGIIDYKWIRVNERNVKTYFMTTRKIEISFSSGQPELIIKKKGSSTEVSSSDFIDFTPPKIRNFVGRKEELSTIGQKSKVFITGISGIGKTSLAAKFAQSVKKPVFWHELREVDSLDYLLIKMSSFLKTIGRKNTSRMIQIGASNRMITDYCISEFRKSGSILIFDDLQLCKDKNIKRFIEDLSRSEPSLKIIAISKESSPPTNGYYIMNLRGLSYEDSISLLRSAGKRHDANTISSLGGHPLALSLIGRTTEEKLTRETLVSTLINEIREYLGNSERETLIWAAAFREGFTIEELNYAIGKEVRKEVDALMSKGLISSTVRTYYVHEFVRVAASFLQKDPKYVHNKLGYYYDSDHKPTSIIEAIYHFGEAENNGLLVKLLKENAAVLIDSGFSEPLLSTLNSLKRRILEPTARGWILLWIAKIEQMSGNFALSLELSEEILKNAGEGDEELATRANLWIGQTLNALGKNEESLEILKKTLRIAHEKLDKKDLEADLLLALNWTLSDLGHFEEAQSLLSHAITLYNKIGDRRNYFVAIFYRGYNNYLRGNLTDSIKDMEEAYSGLFEMNRIISAAACLLHTALAFWRKGNPNRALLILKKSIEMYKDQNEKLGDEHLLLSLCYCAIISSFNGKIVMAEKYLQELESLREKEDDIRANMVEGFARGIINAHKGNWGDSDYNLDMAEKAAEAYADHYFICDIKKWRGWMLMKMGSNSEAIKKLDEVMKIAEKFGLNIFKDDIRMLLTRLHPLVTPHYSGERV